MIFHAGEGFNAAMAKLDFARANDQLEKLPVD